MLYFGVCCRGSDVSDRSMLPTQIDLRPLGEAELHVDRTFSPEQVMGHVGGARGAAGFRDRARRRTTSSASSGR